jgi:hypothetical protein
LGFELQHHAQKDRATRNICQPLALPRPAGILRQIPRPDRGQK